MHTTVSANPVNAMATPMPSSFEDCTAQPRAGHAGADDLSVRAGHAEPIDDIAALTPAWLTAALGGTPVDAVASTRIGVGEGFASRLYRLRPTYAAGHAGPATLILKLQTDNAELRKVLNPDVAYREARFYLDLAWRDLAGDVAQPLPHVPYADFDVARGCFSILMEDLPGIRFGFEATAAESAAAMRALGAIHGRFWGHPVLGEAWLQPVANTDIDLHWLVGHAIAAAEASGHGASHLTRAMRVLRPLVARLASEPRMAPPVRAHSLCHGDFHRNNSVLQNDGRFVVFDWQVLEAGNPLRDVAYWMLTSLTAEQRRAQQASLLRTYHAALQAAGVRDYGRAALQQDFRSGMLENLVRVYCIPALVQADPELLELLRGRVEAASQDMHTIAIAHLLRATVRLRDAWRRLAA